MNELEAFYLDDVGWRSYRTGEYLAPPPEPNPEAYGAGVYGDGIYGGELD